MDVAHTPEMIFKSISLSRPECRRRLFHAKLKRSARACKRSRLDSRDLRERASGRPGERRVSPPPTSPCPFAPAVIVRVVRFVLLPRHRGTPSIRFPVRGISSGAERSVGTERRGRRNASINKNRWKCSHLLLTEAITIAPYIPAAMKNGRERGLAHLSRNGPR